MTQRTKCNLLVGLFFTALCSWGATPAALGGGVESTAAEGGASQRDLHIWRASALTFVAAHAFDYASSAALRGTPGVFEANRLQADANGQYALGRGAAFKVGTTCGLLVPEYLVMRKYPKMARVFSYINFGASAVPIWAGAHNLSLMHR